jgi:hypothetical protein
MIGSPDQPGADGQGASSSETLSYVHDIIRELKQLADKAGYTTLSAILGAALVEAHAQSSDSSHEDLGAAGATSQGAGASDTSPLPWRSMRPASASSMSAICTVRLASPVPRTSASISTAAGPSASTMRLRSRSEGRQVRDCSQAQPDLRRADASAVARSRE